MTFDILDRIERAMEKVRDRLLRSTSALEAAGIPYAVIGGNAVAAWVARVDDSLVRTTKDVDILLRRADLSAARVALEAAGFIYRHSAGMDMFLDGPDAKARDAVHVLMAEERVKSTDLVPAPNVSDIESEGSYKILTLELLVRMKLTSYRRKDQVHVQDMIQGGLVDESWLPRVPAELTSRLQELLDDPTG